jgi:uncharacterized membrane protein YraQ (UPF0718 family)
LPASFSLQEFQLLGRLAIAIVLEAAPFLLLGSLFSAALDRWGSTDRLARLIPAGRAAQCATGLLGGMLLPVCECGVVPVARRLMSRQVPPLAVITYMLAGPVINPIVLASTYVAFGGNVSMTLARVGVVGVTAAAVACWVCRGGGTLLRETAGRPPEPAECGCCGAEHHPLAAPAAPAAASRLLLVDLLRRTALEFMTMGKFLIVGALAASAFKVFLPWQAIQVFAGNLPLSVALMMALAILLSVCSEADAFVAASFVYFPAAARLAFIAVGPMVDLKLIGMLLAVFKQRTACLLIVLPVVFVYVLSMLLAGLLR